MLVSLSLATVAAAAARRAQASVSAAATGNLAFLGLVLLRGSGRKSALPFNFMVWNRMNVIFRLLESFITKLEDCQAASPLTSLFPNKMEDNPAIMGAQTMFPKINPLPGSKDKSALLDGNAQVHARQGSADMRG